MVESYILPGGEGHKQDWGPWSSPSECSRTCGIGVSYETRECMKSDSKCKGGNKKYFTCNTHECPEDEIDFRQQQCSDLDGERFLGVYYTWVPYQTKNNCQLNCMPRGEKFYHQYKSQVIDGTRCKDDSICVDGQCQVQLKRYFSI